MCVYIDVCLDVCVYMCLCRNMHICAHTRGVDLELGFWVASCKPPHTCLPQRFKRFIFYVYMYGHVVCHSTGRGQRGTLGNWILPSTI